MRIKLCGFFHLEEVRVSDDKVLTIPCVFDKELLKENHYLAWMTLEDAGIAEKSFVDVVATITEDFEEEKQPYAIVVYEKGIESCAKAMEVAERLTWGGIHVEKYAQIEFYQKDKLEG